MSDAILVSMTYPTLAYSVLLAFCVIYWVIAATGIVDTATGEAVVLTVNGSGVVEGKTALTGQLVFTVSVNSAGTVTLDQVRAIVHPTTNPDEGKTLNAANLVTLTATIADKDGDTDSATIDIGF